MATAAGTVLDFIKSIYESPQGKTVVLDIIQKSEGGVEGFIVASIKNSKKPPGAIGILYGYFEPQLEAYVTNLVAANGPAVLYAVIDSELSAAAKSAGG